ncbi:hypothetical protein Lery_0449 [Legionella erythra]|uniref:Transmembrane protein n=2 Tax=Legionella erythra TaxID=448 RepID=A0A0W0TVP7_LEGER|nr:hypothetical protein Lery_0449 [Legionella erythra]
MDQFNLHSAPIIATFTANHAISQLSLAIYTLYPHYMDLIATYHTMHTEAYQTKLRRFSGKIERLPNHEIKYFLLLLLTTLKQQPKPYFHAVLEAAIELTDQCHAFLSLHDTASLDSALQKLQKSYHALVKIAGTNSIQTQLVQGILNIGGALAALVLGILGGLIGGFSGLIRAGARLENPFKHALIGFITGFFVGAMIGFRAPKKWFKEETFRQIKYTLDGLWRSLNHLASSQYQPLNRHIDELKKRLLSEYFNNNQDALDQFLDSPQTYQILTFNARFISDALRGYVGHHALIKLTIGDKDLALEFSLGGSNLKQSAAQCENRQVDGRQLLSMMALHEHLQATHACTKQFIATRMKPGETDCLSYVNLILTGTNQAPTRLKRLTDQDSLAGKMVGFFATCFSPFPQTALHPQNTSLENWAPD